MEQLMKNLLLLLPFLFGFTLQGVQPAGVTFGESGAGDITAPTMTINEFSGKCPICEKEGKKSKVFERGCHSTLMASYAYYDEDGNYHYHDPNVTTCEYGCSNGHVFSVSK
jgi:hypothetical protein